jgi:hypothetical protein
MMNGEWFVAQQPLEMLKSSFTIDVCLVKQNMKMLLQQENEACHGLKIDGRW